MMMIKIVGALIVKKIVIETKIIHRRRINTPPKPEKETFPISKITPKILKKMKNSLNFAIL